MNGEQEAVGQAANSSELLGMCLDCLAEVPIMWVVRYIAETRRMPEVCCPQCGGTVSVPFRPVYQGNTGRIVGGWLKGQWFDA
jgi:hypothetical protein